jgi:hypothetical protein
VEFRRPKLSIAAPVPDLLAKREKSGRAAQFAIE